MSGLYRPIGIVVAVCLSSVTGIDFTLSRSQINLGNTIDTYWTMNCSMTDSDVNSVSYIKILRESKKTGEAWDVIATVTASGTVLSGNLPSDLNDNNVNADGIRDNATPTNSKLGVSMDSASLSCDDERNYRCELLYLQSISLETVNQAQTVTLTVSAPASIPVLRDMGNSGGTASFPKSMAVCELLTLTCEADIGTDSSRTISWQKSSETTTALIGYNGYVDDGTANVDNSGGSANSCKYRRTSTMQYNTTNSDASRSDQFPLRFSCYVVTPSENDPLFYVDVSDGSGGHTTTCVMSSSPTKVSENDERVQSNTFVIGFVSGFATCLCSGLLFGLIVFLYRRIHSTISFNNHFRKRQNNAGKATALHGKNEHFYENSISADVLRLKSVHSEGQGQENRLQVTALAHNNTDKETLEEDESTPDNEIPASSNSDQQCYTSLSIEPGEHVYKDLSSR